MDPVKPAEIEVAHAPEARADLVEEAARLAEIIVFRELADLGHREGGEDFPVVKDVHDVGDEGFVAGAASMNLAPAAPFYADVKTVLGRTYQKIMSDPSLNIEAEVQAAAKEINKIIADNT